MTPGQLALQEAARLEAARVYSQLSPEHRQPRTANTERHARLDARVRPLRDAGQSLVAIAVRLGESKHAIRHSLQRLDAA